MQRSAQCCSAGAGAGLVLLLLSHSLTRLSHSLAPTHALPPSSLLCPVWPVLWAPLPLLHSCTFHSGPPLLQTLPLPLFAQIPNPQFSASRIPPSPSPSPFPTPSSIQAGFSILPAATRPAPFAFLCPRGASPFPFRPLCFPQVSTAASRSIVVATLDLDTTPFSPRARPHSTPDETNHPAAALSPSIAAVPAPPGIIATSHLRHPLRLLPLEPTTLLPPPPPPPTSSVAATEGDAARTTTRNPSRQARANDTLAVVVAVPTGPLDTPRELPLNRVETRDKHARPTAEINNSHNTSAILLAPARPFFSRIMTDKLPPLSTPIVLPSQPAFSLAGAVPARDVAPKQETAEEEPYTIKCICNFPDDDGNTIFCETCETWQHIECYYPDNMDDALRPNFSHSCVECQPRHLDRQQAIARQRARTTVPIVAEAADKKPKRPPSKSHKKKPKPSELQINGVHPLPSSESTKHASPQDANPHPPKKAKNSHKPSQSVSSQAPKRSPSSHGNAKAAAATATAATTTHAHPLSPATTPPDVPDDFELHSYSSGFLSSYNDQSYQIVNTNSFAGLQVSSTMSAWLRDPKKLQDDTSLLYDDVFQKLPDNIDSIRARPEIEQTKKATSTGAVVQWPCLTAPSTIDKDVPLIEVNGQIGIQLDYCADKDNRWNELSAPLPFVLFHPFLPLYIDTRREGSEARFVRRSCRPNAILETYLSAGSEYHFWLVSDRPIAAKEQITIPWDFRLPNAEKARVLRLLGLGDNLPGAQPEQSTDDNDYQKYANWVYLILSENGGCACSLGSDCAFARFHRNYLAKTQPRPNQPKSKKRKPKAQQAISPTSTGHATNSRAPSEGHLEEIPEQDRRSVSSSSRSKPPSRDMTPTAVRQGSLDTLGILTEPTDRDKRKVAMVEDTFRRMEQQQQQPQRKRKRVSDGTTTSQTKTSKPNSAAQTPSLPSGFPERGYVDAGTGTARSKSRSPSGVSPTRALGPQPKHSRSRTGSAAPRSHPAATTSHSNYCDAAVQTDFPDPNETATPKRRIGSCLRKRMLENWHNFRLEEEERIKRRAIERPSTAMSVDSQGDRDALLSSPASVKEGEVGEASAASASRQALASARSVSPMTATGSASISSLPKIRSPELRVQMPPVPAFEPPVATPSSASTPVSAGHVALQSPFSVTTSPSPLGPPPASSIVATPSPVKKKLSLSDYKSRMNKAAAARPSVGTTLKPVSAADEPKSATSTDGAGVGSSPAQEKAADSATNPTPAATTSTTNGSV